MQGPTWKEEGSEIFGSVATPRHWKVSFEMHNLINQTIQPWLNQWLVSSEMVVPSCASLMAQLVSSGKNSLKLKLKTISSISHLLITTCQQKLKVKSGQCTTKESQAARASASEKGYFLIRWTQVAERLESRQLFLLKSTFDCCTQHSSGGWDPFNTASIRKRATVDE